MQEIIFCLPPLDAFHFVDHLDYLYCKLGPGRMELVESIARSIESQKEHPLRKGRFCWIGADGLTLGLWLMVKG